MTTTACIVPNGKTRIATSYEPRYDPYRENQCRWDAECAQFFPSGIMQSTINSTDELGRAIRAERKVLGLTQGDLAAACGVSLRFVSELERGRASAGVGRILRVLHMLGLRVVLESPRDADDG